MLAAPRGLDDVAARCSRLTHVGRPARVRRRCRKMSTTDAGWPPREGKKMLIYGLNPVREALRSGRVQRVRVGARGDKRVDEILVLAREHDVPVERVDVQALDRAARGGVHQGIVAELAPQRDYAVTELIE